MTEQLCDFPTCQLARQKGFDEKCRYLWMANNGKPKAIDPPKDEEMMENIRGLIVKHLHDLPGLLAKMGASSPKPLHNSRLPEGIYARPTQDLLERWLREVHGIHIENVYAIGTKYIDQYTEYWYRIVDSNGLTLCATKYYITFELAREAAIVHALKLLPDA